MKKTSQIVLCVIAGILAIALVMSLVSLNHKKKVLQEQSEIIRINSAFYYVRDMYLKCNAEDRSGEYAFLTQMSEFLHSEDNEAQAVADLVLAVRTYVPPNSSHVDEVSKKIEAIKIFTDTRSGNCDLSVDVDVIHRLIDEISQYQPE